MHFLMPNSLPEAYAAVLEAVKRHVISRRSPLLTKASTKFCAINNNLQCTGALLCPHLIHTIMY